MRFPDLLVRVEQLRQDVDGMYAEEGRLLTKVRAVSEACDLLCARVTALEDHLGLVTVVSRETLPVEEDSHGVPPASDRP